MEEKFAVLCPMLIGLYIPIYLIVLKLNMERFRKMCIISGTDYNNNCSNYNIFYYYDIYKDGGKIELTPNETMIYNLYDLNDEKTFKDLLIENGSINKLGICEIMSKYNFICI